MWLRAAAATVGVGAAVAVAQGVASADTGDASDPGHTAASSAKSASASAKPAVSKSGLAGPTKSSARLSAPQSSAVASTATKPPASASVRTPSSKSARVLVTQSAAPDVRSTRSSALDTGQVASLSAQPDVAVTKNTDGSVRVINGTFTDTKVTSAGDAATLLNGLAPVLGAPTGFATADNITVQHAGTTDAATGDIAETFYRFHDSVNGVPVLGSEVIVVTNESGTVTGVFNNLDARTDDIDLTTNASSSQAAAAALSAYASTSTGDPFGRAVSAALSVPTVKPELVVYAFDANSAPQLAWKVVVDPSQTAKAIGVTATDTGTTYYVAANGASAGNVIVSRSNAQALATVPGSTTATDELGGTRTVNISSLNLLLFSVNLLQDVPRTISTFDTGYLFFIGPPALPGTQAFQGLFGWNPVAISAQANIAETYDYYDDVLGLQSFDGNGAPVNLSIGYNPSGPLLGIVTPYNNAYWDPDAQQFAFGAGNLGSALDIVAHEYTHGVVSYAVGSGDSPLSGGESGALNEAYADIMGSLIEGKTGTDRWLMGEDSDFPGGPLRNLANPTSISGYKDTYATRYTGSGDNGGEHYNSTIFSHAAYLMMTDPATSDISEDTWAKVYYHSLYRLSPGADFSDGRAAVVDTATEYGFTPAQLAAVTNAYNAVGIV
jgi:bacillolysin